MVLRCDTKYAQIDDYTIDLIKEKVGISDAWHMLGLGDVASFEKNLRCPFHQDRHQSFSIYCSGQRWKCCSCGRGGDVIQFVIEVKQCGFKEAINVLAQLAETRLSIDVQQCQQICKHVTADVILADDYFAGCEYLLDNDNIAHEIDKWRVWPNGTASTLAKNGLISITNKSVAFGVYEPCIGKSGYMQMRLIGYHARIWPDNPVREDWKYVQSAHESGYSVGEWQCVPGGEYTSTAKYAAIFEGWRDAICFASNCGWLKSDTSWPEDVTIFGVCFVTDDGTSIEYREFVEKYISSIYVATSVHVFPGQYIFDGYKAQMAGKVQEPGYTAIISNIINAGCKDFTDVLTASCLGIKKLECFLAEKQEVSSWR